MRRVGPLYATIIRELQKRPMTAKELAAKLGCEPTESNIRRLVAGLMQRGLLRIDSWRVVPGRGGPAVAVIGAGDAPDAPYPIHQRKGCSSGVMTRRPKTARPIFGVELCAFAEAYRALMRDLCSIEELRDASGMSRVSLRHLLNHMRGIGLAHIGGWCGAAPLYALGKRADKPRPAPIPKAVVSAAYRARLRAGNQFAQMGAAFRQAA